MNLPPSMNTITLRCEGLIMNLDNDYVEASSEEIHVSDIVTDCFIIN